MESPLQNAERRVREVLLQITNETTIFERLMYKNVNQHRRALYFRRLCQVRRDLRLLQSANLMELIQNISRYFENNPTKPSIREGRRKSKGMEWEVLDMRRRLYGVARLLEQMCDPILNASSQVAGLLGRTFFMPFALTALSILARVRVLLLQCLHDLLTIFNLYSEWALNKELIDHKFNDLPISVNCKWDGKKLSLVAASTHHQHELETEKQGFVEDCNGRKYTVLESLVLGETDAQLVEAPNEGVKEIMQIIGSTFTTSDMQFIESNSSMPSVEKAEVCKSMERTQVIDRKDRKNNTNLPTLQNQVLAQGLHSELLREDIPNAEDDFVSVPKKVAYVSVFSTSNSETEKPKEKTPPLKKQKKDSLFDMLLGLGGETHKRLF